MAYRMITQTERDVARVGGFAGAYADLMAGTLTTRWRKHLEKGQEVIDIRQVQLCVRVDLEDLRQQISEIEHDHLSRLTNDKLSREVRDGTIPQLRAQLTGIKALFEGGYAAGSSIKVFGPDTSIPLEALPLRRVGFIARRKLMDPELVLPDLAIGGVTVSPKGMAKHFEPYLFELDTVLTEIEATLPLTSGTLAEKIETLGELRRQAGIAARFLEALYHLAGKHELAKRVRDSTHRSRRPDPDPSDPAPAVADPGGEGDAQAAGTVVETAAVAAIAAQAAAEAGEPADADNDGKEERAALPRAA